MRWLSVLVVLAGLLSSAPAEAQDDDLTPMMLEGPVKTLYVEAMRRAEAEDWSRALPLWRRVIDTNPEVTRARWGVVLALEGLGRRREAVNEAEALPSDPFKFRTLTRLLLALDEVDGALDAAMTLDDYLSNADSALAVARVRVHVDADAARDDLARALQLLEHQDDADELQEVVVETALVLARARNDAEDADGDEQMAELLSDVLRWYPSERERVRQVLERLEVEVEARALSRAAPAVLTGEQRRRLDEARRAFAEADLTVALGALEQLARDVPRSPEVHGALADARELSGDIAGAERAVQRAVLLAPMEPRHVTRLAEILADHYAGRFDDEAIRAYARALRLDPTRYALLLELARLEARSGRLDAAVDSVERYLARVPDDPDGIALRASLQRVRPEPATLPAGGDRDASVPTAAYEPYFIAMRYFQRTGVARERATLVDDLDQGLAEVRLARELAPTWVAALNLEGAMRLHRSELVADAGEVDAARALYERSLTLEPAQPGLLTTLALMDWRRGEKASALEQWRVAEGLEGPGAAEASFYLARWAADEWYLWQARRHLDAYVARETTGKVHDEARALREVVESRIQLVYVTVAGTILLFLALGLGMPAFIVWRRRAGVDLEVFLARSPESFRDVARIGSRLRHEVLKHNTTVLVSVADAVESGDDAPLKWAAQNLYGERGALDKFDELLRELGTVAQRQGVRLNLRYRDHTFGPMLKAADRLRKLESSFGRGGGRRFAAELREISAALNEVGYRALGGLLRRLCLLEVDEQLVESIWGTVLSEPDFREAGVPDLELDLPRGRIWLRMYRGELEDILANLIRNAVRATVDQGQGRIGLAIAVEEDWVTGLERVAFRVKDDAPRRITTAMIRSRYIERGLGITVDLISRSGGSIHVEDEGGWSKAIVVRIPRAEGPAEAVEGEA